LEILVSPHLIDFILGFVVLEVIVIHCLGSLRTRKSSRLSQWRAVVVLVLPGVCLLLAIRVAMSGALWPWLPVALLAALATHLLDVRERWRR
jgi:NhaP-type Na+/H+ or K+/H+ antiporter